MPTVDVVVESPCSTSIRARQVCSMFDVPPSNTSRLEWRVEVPSVDDPWSVGLIVGPSGSGKSSVMREVYGEMPTLRWDAASVVDDVAQGHSVQAISEAFGAVGFNTIPSWTRPYAVLSNGEKFRVDLARRLLELPSPVVVDEFTSVVDRQVAQIGSHAVQKYARRTGKKFVAVTCHYDVADWLQPDWVLDMATQSFTRRLLQQRPAVECVIGRVPYTAWAMFAPYHYLTADLNRAARCFGLWANGRLAAFAGALYRPHPTAQNVMGLSRLVTLPDFQGLGLAFVLADAVGSAYRALGKRWRSYPAHPALVRAFDRSTNWRLEKRPGVFGTRASETSSAPTVSKGRPCAVFEYVGRAMERAQAEALVSTA